MLVYDRKSTPSLRDPAVHLIHSSLGWRVHASNDIWIGSAILAQRMLMTNRQTYRQTVSSEDKKTSEKLKVYFSSCISLCTNCCTQHNTAQKCHQCFGTVGVRKSIQSTKIEWWGVGMVICLEWGADCLAEATAIPKPHHLFPNKNFRIGFFLAMAYSGCPGKEAVKGVVILPTMVIAQIYKGHMQHVSAKIYSKKKWI